MALVDGFLKMEGLGANFTFMSFYTSWGLFAAESDTLGTPQSKAGGGGGGGGLWHCRRPPSGRKAPLFKNVRAREMS